MLNKLFVFLIILVVALGENQYGVLEAGQFVEFSVDISYSVEVCLLSFQGPIKLAKVNEDKTLTDIAPLNGTYLYYDYPQNVTGKNITYRVYGSLGGATYPQYKFVQFQYYGSKQKVTELETYQNQTVKFRSEDGYLIIDIPLIQYKNQSYIGSNSFNIVLGKKQDAQVLRLLTTDYYDPKIVPANSQNYYQPMSYSNYQTTTYLKLDPQNDYNYFAVSDGQFLLGGYEFEPNFEKNNQNTWIWITITLIAILAVIGVLIFRARRKLSASEESKEPLEQSIQGYN